MKSLGLSSLLLGGCSFSFGSQFLRMSCLVSESLMLSLLGESLLLCLYSESLSLCLFGSESLPLGFLRLCPHLSSCDLGKASSLSLLCSDSLSLGLFFLLSALGFLSQPSLLSCSLCLKALLLDTFL